MIFAKKEYVSGFLLHREHPQLGGLIEDQGVDAGSVEDFRIFVFEI
jgi:hypothetical protein